jgi:phosphoribosylglycinamide formyltransferase
MIHKVISEVDMGEPLLVQEIEFKEGEDDDIEAFEQKVHAVEWKAIIEGINIAISALRKKQLPNTDRQEES